MHSEEGPTKVIAEFDRFVCMEVYTCQPKIIHCRMAI